MSTHQVVVTEEVDNLLVVDLQEANLNDELYLALSPFDFHEELAYDPRKDALLTF